jgi:hypothetical protein
MTAMRWWWIVGIAVAAGSGAVTVEAQLCTADRDCEDGLFCNGLERCAPGDARADVHGCIPASRRACAEGTRCFEDDDACRRACADNDGDGHSAAHCGGDDCDDGDANRFPGNVEVCDGGSHDEDCDATTFGTRDEDQDGEVDARCCNRDPRGVEHCGADCDDENRSILPNAQVCDGRGVAICGAGLFEAVACTPGTVCIPQPNGTGVCGAEPADYAVPPRFVSPKPRPLPGSAAMKERLEARPPVIKPRLQLRAPPAGAAPKAPPSQKKDGGGGVSE